jgi:hypothetical protein
MPSKQSLKTKGMFMGGQIMTHFWGPTLLVLGYVCAYYVEVKMLKIV